MPEKQIQSKKRGELGVSFHVSRYPRVRPVVLRLTKSHQRTSEGLATCGFLLVYATSHSLLNAGMWRNGVIETIELS
jgi:hypothetical protein